MNRRLGIILYLGLALAGAGGCKPSEPADKPPQIHFGRDECAECGMILNDDRFAAAIVIQLGNGDFQTRIFDDIGEMPDFEREHADLTIVKRYVHDYESRQWINAATATFLKSPEIHTPMGSGIAGFANPARAQAVQREKTGEILTGLFVNRLTSASAPNR